MRWRCRRRCMRQLRRCRKLRCAESLLHTTIAMTRASMLCAAAWSQQRARPIWRLACCFGRQSLRRSAEGNARVPCLLPACRLHAHGSERGGQGHLQPERRARLVSVGERCSTWPLVQMCRCVLASGPCVDMQPPTNWAAAVHQRHARICASMIVCRSQLGRQRQSPPARIKHQPASTASLHTACLTDSLVPCSKCGDGMDDGSSDSDFLLLQVRFTDHHASTLLERTICLNLWCCSAAGGGVTGHPGIMAHCTLRPGTAASSLLQAMQLRHPLTCNASAVPFGCCRTLKWRCTAASLTWTSGWRR